MKCEILITSPYGDEDFFTFCSESFNEIEAYTSGRLNELAEEWYGNLRTINETTFEDFLANCEIQIKETK